MKFVWYDPLASAAIRLRQALSLCTIVRYFALRLRVALMESWSQTTCDYLYYRTGT